MKYFCLTLLSLFSISYASQAQTVLNPEWVKQVNATEGGNAEAWGVDVDDSGNVYWPINAKAAGSNMDVFCYKLNTDGEELWSEPFHFVNPVSQFSHICDASSDAVYVGGSSCVLPGVNCDMHIIKIDKTSGELIWDESEDFGNNGYDEIDGLEVRDDGIYCGGWAQALQTGLWQTDIGLWKLDSEGTTLWTEVYGEQGTSDHQDGHFVVQDGVITTTGMAYGTSVTNLFNGRSFISQYSTADGAFIDSTDFVNDSLTAFIYVENPLGMTTDGSNFYITGYTTPTNLDNWQIFVSKFDADLNKVWTTNYGGSISESARGIVVHDERVYVAGLTSSPEITASGDGDALLLVLDTDGNMIADYVWGGDSLDTFRDLVIHDNDLYLSGASGTGYSSETSYTANLLKVSLDDVVGIRESKPKASALEIFPNPSKGMIRIRMKGDAIFDADFTLYNMLGDEVYQSKLVGREVQFNLSLEPGAYLYSLNDGATILDSGTVLIIE